MVNKKNIAIVIPSYKQLGTIYLLRKKILNVLPKAKIIIVDDSPKDGNLKLKTLLKKEKNIKLISRFKKLGRGSAVLAGFKEAFKNKTIEHFFEMDSDLAHDPKQLLRFIEKIENSNLDLVVGSRYLPGGKVINVPRTRVILSIIINKFLRFWLGIRVSDFTGGYRLYSRKAVEFLINNKFESSGFITLSEIIFKLNKNKYRIGEVPITITQRESGKSNVNLKELLVSLFFILKMRIKDFFTNEKFVKILVILFIIFLAFSVRIATINKIGRTWDEQEYIEQGYKMIELIKKGDFGNSYFYTTYNHPPLVKYLYGITAHFDVERISTTGEPIFKYDYTFSRILSVTMFSIGIFFTVLIGWKLFSPTVGVISGIILSMLPFSLGLSQLVTAESLKILTYPLTIYSYIPLLKNRITTMNILFAGVATGIVLQAKQTNFILVILLGIIFLVQCKHLDKKDRKDFLRKKLKIFLAVCLIGMLVFIALWPQFIFHIKDVWYINQKLWNIRFSSKIWQITLAPPEIFFGKLRLVPVFYYIVYFFISIPLLVLVLFFLGLKKILSNKNIYSLTLILWFLLPFGLSIYSWRQHGLRYIIEIYPAIALISALGFDNFVNKITTNKIKKFLYFIPIFTYLFIALWQIKPYYLDYFNELVGGVNNVYDKKLFQIGWWGQGVGEAGYYLKENAPKSSKIGLAISPSHVFPVLKDFDVLRYKKSGNYDYVVVNYYNIIREAFDDSPIVSNYEPVYKVFADKAVLVTVYKKK